ncbi:MAG: DNA topoisomerase VI subunit B [Candidatus Diapherotrites archaeon]|nr:DNA topoisomerase VI subunit B [Candidatus Diapherotrites archaeon]
MTQADTIFKEFKEHSVAEFFKKNRQMLGYSGKIRSLTTIVHEYVTNALDACEEHGVLPEITVKVEQLGNDHYRVTVTDNGPGIPQSHIGKVFAQMLSGTKFHRFIQQRGQQGIGASGCTMYAQITTGKPIHVITSTGKGKVYEANVMIDVKKNSPLVTDEKEYDGDFTGTTVIGEFKDVQYQQSDKSPGEYVRRTALANPHAKITFIDPNKLKTVYERAVTVLPKKGVAAKPHPKGLEIDDLIEYAHHSKERTIKTFLVNTFDRMSAAKAKEIEELTSIDFQRKPDSISWKDAEEIVDAIKKTQFLAPSTAELRPIGESTIERSFLNVLEPEFHSIRTRKPAVYRGGVPFQVEVGMAYGGKAGRGNENGSTAEILRFANRAPLLFDGGGCAITKAVNSIDWKRYQLRNIETLPLSIFVNICSTYVPYTGAGKQAISDEDEVMKDLGLALMEVARDIKSYVTSERRKYEKHTKKLTLTKYIPEISRAVSELTGAKKEVLEANLLRIVNDKYENGGDEEAEEEAGEEQ